MARTITFQPNQVLEEFIEGLIETGSYNNQSEVIRDALRQLQEKTAASKLQQLKTLIAEGENSGALATWSAEDFLARMKKKPHV